MSNDSASQTARRLEVTSVFLKLGVLGFGAPAIWALIQAEVQERRGWLSKERFLEGLALVNALPGAPAMQMCIFAGHQRAGWWGGVLAGLAFMAPAFAIVLALSALAAAYGALPVLRDAFYGLGPVVLGIFVGAAAGCLVSQLFFLMSGGGFGTRPLTWVYPLIRGALLALAASVLKPSTVR